MTISLTWELRPEVATTTGSPTLIWPGDDRAGIAAEIEIGPVDPLHRKAERLCLASRSRHRRSPAACSSVGPRYHGVLGDGSVTLSPNRAEIGIGDDGCETERAGEGAVIVGDALECVLVEADQIDLVDREHDVADAKQRADQRMPPGLHQHALARIDQDDGQLGGRGAGRHVAGVLLVARRVGDDERALRGGEEAVGDVDGDALLALGLEPVDQQREIDVVAGRAVPRESLTRLDSWSSKMSFESCSSRPISVDLPSSTEPQVMKRSRSLVGPLSSRALGESHQHQK